MPDYHALIAQNNRLWASAQFHSDKAATAKTVAAKICAPAAKAVYAKLQAVTGVPWWVIGVIHYRECGLSWKGSLSQGDPWNSKSVHVPIGRGPFSSFVDAAVDALVKCAPFASRWKDWSPGGALTLLELYNGTGYEHHGVPSPYVWSGTQHYVHGKFVKDHDFEMDVVDKQLGCAIILHEMQAIDDSVMVFGAKEPNPDEYPEPHHADVPDAPPAVDRPDTGDVPTPTPSPADDGQPTVLDTAKDQAKQVARDKAGEVAAQAGDKAKSIFMSKIGWLQGIIGTAAAAALSNVEDMVHNPVFWFGVVIVVCVALTIYFRWKDHGGGKS